jgi:hypothetical protein
MTPKPKRPARPAARRAASPSVRPAAASKPFLRFHHSDALRARTLAVVSALEGSARPEDHAGALADLVVALTAAGMDAYFMKPLEKAQAGFIVRQTASLGIAGAMQVIGSAIRNIVGRMDGPQLVSVCGSIRQFMR